MMTNNICPQCGQAFTGRKDKTYCSSACRAQNHRVQLAAEAAAVKDEVAADYLDVPAVLPVALAAAPPGAERRRAAEWADLSAAARDDEDEAEAAEQAWAALHARYAEWVQTWLQQEGTPLRARAVSRHLATVETLSARYRAHPAIAQPSHPAWLRLQLLYKVGDALRELQQDLGAQAASFWGPALPEGALTFTKRRRQQLRDSLVGSI